MNRKLAQITENKIFNNNTIYINLNILRMSKRFLRLIICLILSVFLGTNTANAQLFQDTATLNLIKKDIDCIYNMQFKDSQELYTKIRKSYPGHPVLFLLKGMQTYWMNYPLLNTTSAHVSFEADLRECIRISEKNKVTAYEAEYLLTDLCARGMLMEYYNSNNLTFEVIPLVTSTYRKLRHAFAFTGVCKDLQYYTGVYNYYREAYPLAYPIYKPLVLLLPSGNMKTGLTELQRAAINGVVLRAESNYLLAGIYLNFEKKYQQAISYSSTLYRSYPDNELYQAMYIKNLLLLGHYDEAENLIKISSKGGETKYLQAQLIIFKGVLQEKKYHNNNLAKQYYHSGISKLSLFSGYGSENTAYANSGLSRISKIKVETGNGNHFKGKTGKLVAFKMESDDN